MISFNFIARSTNGQDWHGMKAWFNLSTFKCLATWQLVQNLNLCLIWISAARANSLWKGFNEQREGQPAAVEWTRGGGGGKALIRNLKIRLLDYWWSIITTITSLSWWQFGRPTLKMSQKSNFWLESGSIGLKQKLKPYRNCFTSFTEMLMK